MEKKGMVSLWLGNCLNKEELEKYVDLTYDDEGESVPSKFLLDFKIDMNEIDEDFIEKAVLNNPSNDLTKLLNGSSYEEVIVPKLLIKINIKANYNAIILLYDFEYEEIIGSANKFDYIASVNYI